MADLIILLVVAAILAAAGLYVYKAKKSGHKCVGCPHSKTCSGTCHGCTQK